MKNSVVLGGLIVALVVALLGAYMVCQLTKPLDPTKQTPYAVIESGYGGYYKVIGHSAGTYTLYAKVTDKNNPNIVRRTTSRTTPSLEAGEVAFVDFGIDSTYDNIEITNVNLQSVEGRFAIYYSLDGKMY